MKVVAIIPAAGMGIRMGADTPKQFLLLENMPVLAVTLKLFQECKLIDDIIVLVPEDEIAYCENEIVKRHNFDKVYKVSAGGEKRQDSVRIGLNIAKEIMDEDDITVIHDGVRPLLEMNTLERCINEAIRYPAVIVGIPSKDTIKEVDKEGKVIKTHDREKMWLIQTPQAFRFKEILLAHEKALEYNWTGITDDSMLLEKLGIPVKMIMGSEQNIKITTPVDLELARFICSKKAT